MFGATIGQVVSLDQAGIKTLADTVLNLKLAREEWQGNKALCFHCQTASVVSAVSTVLAFPEAVKAVRKLLDR